MTLKKCMWLTCSYVSSIKNIFDSVIFVYRMSTDWEDTDGCAKQYSCALAIYLMTVLLSSYGIITDCAINAPGHGNNIVGELNATDKRYLKG